MRYKLLMWLADQLAQARWMYCAADEFVCYQRGWLMVTEIYGYVPVLHTYWLEETEFYLFGHRFAILEGGYCAGSR